MDLVNAIQGDANGYGRRLQANVKKVFLTAYPDLLTSDSGATCANSPWTDPLGGITTEGYWARANVNYLTEKMQSAAAAANARPGVHPYWQVIPAPSFIYHGYCANNRWVNTVGDSLYNQGDINGAMHRTRPGIGLGRPDLRLPEVHQLLTLHRSAAAPVLLGGGRFSCF